MNAVYSLNSQYTLYSFIVNINRICQFVTIKFIVSITVHTQATCHKNIDLNQFNNIVSQVPSNSSESSASQWSKLMSTGKWLASQCCMQSSSVVYTLEHWKSRYCCYFQALVCCPYMADASCLSVECSSSSKDANGKVILNIDRRSTLELVMLVMELAPPFIFKCINFIVNDTSPFRWIVFPIGRFNKLAFPFLTHL